MKQGRIIVAGIGPGDESMVTPQVRQAVNQADDVVGYSHYISFVKEWMPEGVETHSTGMTHERARAEKAFDLAVQGRNVVVVSSGDAGIYGMAPLVLELYARGDFPGVELVVLPGISAFQVAASRLGAPVSHDFCVISLSDLMTPWDLIEKRIVAAASADFVTAVYNPASRGRYWQIHRLKELFLRHRAATTPAGIVRQAGRDDETIHITTLASFDPDSLDMFSVMIIGNSSTFIDGSRMITPRGYFRRGQDDGVKTGQSIMINSFRTIAGMLKRDDHPCDARWALIHTIHTTADFEFEDIFHASPGAVATWHRKLTAGGAVIVTDVTMVQSGLRKAALERYGITVHCYLADPRVPQLAEAEGITRTQAGIRLAAAEHPDALFVIGNAPTALMELADLLRRTDLMPMGVIGAPVGFVNVVESKLRLKAACRTTPYVVIEGRKGGSSVAATIVNAALSLEDAEAMKPGRDV
ncbi:MAG TPA: precorrin-3B C(17)-methyltransferase [Prosthecochloris aestuarii]|uniref:Precorrin-3B C(17)-methyltransferase n=1 Tax=Prosthecochloris aestuarii TaxID=1102 RepID=A0A831SUQ8_PROAE|nr:precorrin-3B C(17)-methyltransferase [Prosthecochloris aestuarii]